ncbi:hypothetical protein GCM10012287_26030 [Streptomyces daqingensis]|uniref:Peroxin-7 n=1 Tax=Streptomyces daqingensis TaxID=1472640 RepID=A0ABQ2MB20_9ACTN|nr:hypothetical protein GCM10012287_26030 [Streptomyces daqingensis]
MATAGWDHTVRLWDPVRGECAAMMRSDDDHGCCAWTPSGDALAVAWKRGVYFFDVNHGQGAGS